MKRELFDLIPAALLAFGGAILTATPSSSASESIKPEAGLTWLSYSESPGTDFTAMGARLGLSISKTVGETSRLLVNGSLTGLPVSGEGVSIPVRVGAAEAAWITELAPGNAFRPDLAIGGYYKRMFVTGNRFGYADLNGPFAVLTASRPLSGTTSALMKLRLGAILGDLLPLAPSNRELGLGLEWQRTLAQGRTLGITADWQDLRVRINELPIHSASLTLGVTYGN